MKQEFKKFLSGSSPAIYLDFKLVLTLMDPIRHQVNSSDPLQCSKNYLCQNILTWQHNCAITYKGLLDNYILFIVISSMLCIGTMLNCIVSIMSKELNEINQYMSIVMD